MDQACEEPAARGAVVPRCLLGQGQLRPGAASIHAQPPWALTWVEAKSREGLKWAPIPVARVWMEQFDTAKCLLRLNLPEPLMNRKPQKNRFQVTILMGAVAMDRSRWPDVVGAESMSGLQLRRAEPIWRTDT